jgi:hypothetical protein
MPEIGESTPGTQKLTEFFKKNKLVLPAIAIGGGIGLFFLLKNGGRTIDNSSTFPGETPGYVDQPGGSDSGQMEPDLGIIFDEIAKNQTEYQNILDQRFQDIISNQEAFQSGVADLFNQLQSGIQLGAVPGDYYGDSGYYPTTYDSYADTPLMDTPSTMTWAEKQALIAQRAQEAGGFTKQGMNIGNTTKSNVKGTNIPGKSGQSGGDFLTYLKGIFGNNNPEAERIYKSWKQTGVASYTDPNTGELVVHKPSPSDGVMTTYVYNPSTTPKTNFGANNLSAQTGYGGPKPTAYSQKPGSQQTQSIKTKVTAPVKPAPVKAQPIKSNPPPKPSPKAPVKTKK